MLITQERFDQRLQELYDLEEGGYYTSYDEEEKEGRPISEECCDGVSAIIPLFCKKLNINLPCLYPLYDGGISIEGDDLNNGLRDISIEVDNNEKYGLICYEDNFDDKFIRDILNKLIEDYNNVR